MGIINFIIVLGFNLYFLKDGWQSYFEVYQWKESSQLSIYFYLFALWGIVNLIYSLTTCELC